jgi:hypothetical protein
VPVNAKNLPRRPPERFGSSDGLNGTGGAPISKIEGLDGSAVLRSKYGDRLLSAVCGGTVDPGFHEARPARKLNKSPLPEASE